MSLDRVSVVTPTAPVAVADYQANIAQLEARLDAFSGREIVDGSTIRAGAIVVIGGVAYKATTDTAITGTPSAYVKITPAGATASAAFVASLSGVAWSHTYGGYYDGSGSGSNLVVFDEDLAISIGAMTGSPRTIAGRSKVPAGTVAIWSVAAMPGGWLECAGQAVSRTTYARLFAIVGTTYGVGDGTTTFNLPDLRSASIRGVGTPTRFTDATAVTLNQTINDALQAHTHTYDKPNGGAAGPFSGGGVFNFVSTNSGAHNGRSASETTGKAVGMYYIIKA
jgi:microcystin-dependent protein